MFRVKYKDWCRTFACNFLCSHMCSLAANSFSYFDNAWASVAFFFPQGNMTHLPREKRKNRKQVLSSHIHDNCLSSFHILVQSRILFFLLDGCVNKTEPPFGVLVFIAEWWVHKPGHESECPISLLCLLHDHTWLASQTRLQKGNLATLFLHVLHT